MVALFVHARSLSQSFGGCFICCMLAASYRDLVAALFVACSQLLTGVWWLLYLLHDRSLLHGFVGCLICACSQLLTWIWWLPYLLHARSLLLGFGVCIVGRLQAASYRGCCMLAAFYMDWSPASSLVPGQPYIGVCWAVSFGELLFWCNTPAQHTSSKNTAINTRPSE